MTHLSDPIKSCSDGPDNRLKWNCNGENPDFDCNWVGNWIYPSSLKPRKANKITPMNRDEWIDSVELKEVS